MEEAFDEVFDKAPEVQALVEAGQADIGNLKVDESSDAEIVLTVESDAATVLEVPTKAEDPVILHLQADSEQHKQGVRRGKGHARHSEQHKQGVRRGEDHASHSEQLEISLPGNAKDAEVAEDGSIVFADAHVDTDLIVQAQDDTSVRMLTVLNGPSAPSAFDFPVDLPGREGIALLEDGSVRVLDATGHVAVEVPAPWAIDANGDQVPAWYTVFEGLVTLNVDHSMTNAYPIVADPIWDKVASVVGSTLAIGALVTCTGTVVCGLAVAGLAASTYSYCRAYERC